MLSPVDMVLHGATHLFSESELHRGLRDLSDLDLLMRYFGELPGFWDDLVERADAVGLRRPLYYALTLCSAFLATPVPGPTLSCAPAFGPPRPLGALMGAIYGQVLAGRIPSEEGVSASFAHGLLFVRGHWLRMPMHLLIYHLGHKAMAGARRRRDRAAVEPNQ
jgi:hypothetical protein